MTAYEYTFGNVDQSITYLTINSHLPSFAYACVCVRVDVCVCVCVCVGIPPCSGGTVVACRMWARCPCPCHGDTVKHTWYQHMSNYPN